MPIDFWVKDQGHNASITDFFYVVLFLSLYTYHYGSSYTKTLHESRMCPNDFGVQRSTSKCIDNWKWFISHNCFPFTHIIMNFIQRLPMSGGCALLILGFKGEVHHASITENELCCIIAFPLHVSSWDFIQIIHMSWVYVLLILGSKSQRSKSKCIDYWKWFTKCMLHNCFPFTHIIMKLHTKTPYEFRMCLLDFGVQRLRSQCIDFLKWLFAHNCIPFPANLMKHHTKTYVP